MVEQLTPEKLKAAKFSMTIHLNGGSKFSRLIYTNEEWRLTQITETDGRPRYTIKAKEVQYIDGDAALDMTPPIGAAEFELRVEQFCKEYNEERAPHLTVVHDERGST